MMKVALQVEYDGTRYHGWQRQAEVISVQGELEKALSRVANAPIEVVCAGRTDAGVHATGQIVHFEAPVERRLRSWILGANSNLPADISVLSAFEPDPDFHARFSATARSYRYVILNRATRSALHGRRVTWWFKPLDVARMQEAAKALLGTHDFSSFRAQECQAKSPVRTMESIELRRSGDFIYLDVTANAFLHHMVRNIAGSLMQVGEGVQEPEWIESVLEARDRAVAGMTAPAQGLYLVSVRYPEALGVNAEALYPVYG